MKYLRNREIRLMCIALVLLAAGATAVTAAYSAPAAVADAIAFLFMITVFLLFTRARYRELIRMTAYLKRVNGGEYSLELRDNDEGELSILKSEIYKVTTTLREQNEALKGEKSSLVNSLSDISHQLRTPLTSMFVMTDLLCGSELTEEKRVEFTGCIRQQLERLQWLVEALLKLSRLDAQAVAFKQRRVTPKELIEKACAPLNIPIELKEQSLTVETDGVPFLCDLNWTAEALINILKNCVEHTPRGGKLHISAFTNPLYTQLSVQDSVPGIDGADLPYIFNRFYKGKNAGAESVGIGLAMAKAIVEAQGGSIAAGGGTGGAVFTLRFPKQACV